MLQSRKVYVESDRAIATSLDLLYTILHMTNQRNVFTENVAVTPSEKGYAHSLVACVKCIIGINIAPLST